MTVQEFEKFIEGLGFTKVWRSGGVWSIPCAGRQTKNLFNNSEIRIEVEHKLSFTISKSKLVWLPNGPFTQNSPDYRTFSFLRFGDNGDPQLQEFFDFLIPLFDVVPEKILQATRDYKLKNLLS